LKGQLTIEYMVTFIAFISLIIFVYFQYSSNIPSFITEINKENSRAKAYQLSELLLNDPGQPSDWNQISVERIGLSDQTHNKPNLLSLDKIINLNSTCYSDYSRVQRLLAFDQPFFIYFYNITDSGGRDILLNCTPPSALLEKKELNMVIRRITSFIDENERMNFGELIIEV